MLYRLIAIITTSLLIASAAFPAGAIHDDETEPLPEREIIDDRLIIAFHEIGALDTLDWVAELDGELRFTVETLSWVSVQFPDAESAQDALEAANARTDVRFAEYDGPVHHTIVGSHEPNDPLYSNQWGYPAINAPEAWAHTMGSHDVLVAVLDTGIEGHHEDLEANICDVPHASFIPGEDPLVDGHFHGSHVSGTVAAVTDNNIGVAGTSQSCLMDVKVLSRFGSGSWDGVAAGIIHAADNGADIISMSLGGGQPPQIVEDAVNHAYHDQGVLVIAAAGNSGCWGGNSVIWPAKYDAVMAVASLDSPGNNPSGFSSCGDEVEIAAPGGNVFSTSNNGGYRSASGTSMAAPHISGVAALVMSQAPAASAPEVRCLLQFTADDLGESGWDPETGWGRVNAETAVLTAPLLAGGLLPVSTPDVCQLLLEL